MADLGPAGAVVDPLFSVARSEWDLSLGEMVGSGGVSLDRCCFLDGLFSLSGPTSALIDPSVSVTRDELDLSPLWSVLTFLEFGGHGRGGAAGDDVVPVVGCGLVTSAQRFNLGLSISAECNSGLVGFARVGELFTDLGSDGI